jgi:hypothetical protein
MAKKNTKLKITTNGALLFPRIRPPEAVQREILFRKGEDSVSPRLMAG